MPLWASPLFGLAAGRRCPYGLVAGKQPLAGWPMAAGGASARRRPSCWCRTGRRSPACGLLPLRVAAPCRDPGRNRPPTCRGGLGCNRQALAAGLAMGGRPYMGAGRPSSSLPLLQKHSKNS
ncbi:hypothetical protein GW17_00048633 [Ensete ventricosum]|nr:hypothetical protein GW17_00048633 [Ensete ventricosum]